MIPVKLAMRNFMCYQDDVPLLYFNGIHTACLWGSNGNGKSALIDAITWALWGQTRAKSDDDLVHTGQTEMEVEFEFAVGEQTYRIIRKRARPRRQRSAGQSILEFQMAAGDGFQSITGNSIAQTQQKIVNILHMDYDTFVNSAYLRQGHADEFTNQAPAKRKEVLANILGLSFYDELDERARSLAKQKRDEQTNLESSINEINEELQKKPVYLAELEKTQGELSGIEETMASQEAELKTLRQQKESLEQKQAQLDQLETHLGDTAENMKYWEEQITQHHSRLQEYELLIAQHDAIEKGYARFSEAKSQHEELNQKLIQVSKLNQQISQLDKIIDRAQGELTNNHTMIQSKINDLAIKAQQLPHLKNQLQQVQTQLRQVVEQEEILHRKLPASQELQAKINYLESNQSRLKHEINEIAEKLKLLSSQTEAKCPLCETDLGAEGLKIIESKYAADSNDKSDSLKANQAELASKQTELELLKREISRLENSINQGKGEAQRKGGLLEKEVAEAEEADKQLVSERENLADIEQHLAGKDFAATEQEALRQLEAELARFSYDAEQHEQVRNQVNELDKYDNLKRKLDDADRLINQAREDAARAAEAVQKLKQNLEDDQQKKQELTAELTLLPRLLGNLTQAETENRELVSRRNQTQQVMWNIKAKLDRCAELEVKKQEKEKATSLISRESNIYRDLAKAFGKGGIQALLIEVALPEIEAEANRLLGRMTDNRMHVKFETQRETKKGSVIETLDINISDELGMRNYEMFSGGEAFRINFAIRIALSRLLAKRAGAPLPTLIIDEGFGTQDASGIDKLKEAINSIQDDFDKIIVITHIEELRDAFPIRIDVIKTASGSTISLN